MNSPELVLNQEQSFSNSAKSIESLASNEMYFSTREFFESNSILEQARIKKIIPNGSVSILKTITGHTSNISECFLDGCIMPTVSTDLAIDPSGNLYIAYSHADKVERISSTGEVTVFTGFIHPHGLAIDHEGNVFVSTRPLFDNTSIIAQARIKKKKLHLKV